MALDCHDDPAPSGQEQQQQVRSSINVWSPGALLVAELEDGLHYGVVEYTDGLLDYIVVRFLTFSTKTQQLHAMKSWAGTGKEFSSTWSFARHLGAS